MKRNLTASLMLLLTAMVWGFSVVAQVLGADHLPAMTFNGTRFLLGAVCLIPVYLVAEREQDLDKAARRTRHIKTVRAALIGGCLLAVASALQQTGAGIVRDPGKTGFITGLYTVLTPVFYFLVFHRKSSWNTWVGVGLAVLGLYLLCAKGGDGPLFGEGEVFLLLGVLFWAAHILAVDRLVGDVSVLRFSSWQFLVTGVLNLAAGLVVERGSHGRGLPGSVRCHPVLRYPVGRRRLYVPDSGAKACIQPDFCSHHPVLRVGVLHHRRVAVEPIHAGIPARQPRHSAVGVCGLCLHSGGNRAFPAEFPESGENGCTQQYRASCRKIDGRQKLT